MDDINTVVSNCTFCYRSCGDVDDDDDGNVDKENEKDCLTFSFVFSFVESSTILYSPPFHSLSLSFGCTRRQHYHHH